MHRSRRAGASVLVPPVHQDALAPAKAARAVLAAGLVALGRVGEQAVGSL
jgi:hypothetical protein